MGRWDGGLGDWARGSIFFTKNAIFCGGFFGWGGGGTVSYFFYKESKPKKKWRGVLEYVIFYEEFKSKKTFFLWGEGKGAIVSEFFFTKNPNLNKKKKKTLYS